MNALSGGRSKRYFRISEHPSSAMDIKPHLLRGTGTSVASFGPCVSALAVQNFSSFFVAYCKRPLPRRHTRQPEGSTQHLVSGNSGYEVGRSASVALGTACLFAVIHPPRG